MMLLNEICERNPPDLALGDAKMYKNAINFAFILCMEITTPAFEVTALASNALQEESLDHSTAYKVIDGVIHTIQALRSEEKFAEIFQGASEKAEALNIPLPTVVPGQERKRKVPVRFQHSTTASQVSDECHTTGRVVIDTLTAELNRRFQGSITGSPTGTIIRSFYSLTVCANWTSTPNPEAEEAVHVLCDFYEENEDQLKTELKVFHSNFPLKNLQEILAIVNKNKYIS